MTQENKDHDYSAAQSQVSESGEGDSSSVFLNSSKLRTKLEKLAKWRIDPSLIEFPKDTPEFRGGYATVSRAFLAPSSSAEGVGGESKPTSDEHADSEAQNPQSQNDTQEQRDDQQGKNEKADSRTADGGEDDAEEDSRKASNTHKEPESHRPTPNSKVNNESEPSGHSVHGEPDSGNPSAQHQRDTQEAGDDPQGKGEGMGSHTVGGDNDEEKEGSREFDNHEKQSTRPHALISTIDDGSTSPEHKADKDQGLGSLRPPSQSDAQGPGDEQQGENKQPSSHIADGESDQREEEQKLGRQTSKPKQIVAVKKLKMEEDTDSKRILGLALRESEFLVGLSHPNIVKFEGFVEDLSTQKVWLIFPWEEHGNLRDFLASGEWEIPERISLINDVTLGLEYLHSQQPPIYHGDLKSLNILVSSECHALITDFGSARHLGSDHVSKQPKENKHKLGQATDPNPDEEHITLGALFSATATTLTLTGSSYTLRWAAPELLQEDKPCLRSDIWALGWIAYEVMTNTIPFHDVKKDAAVINRVIQGELPSVTEDARMSLIRALCSLMVQCWSINPNKRPTAEESRKLISWMPKIIPAPRQIIDEAASQLRHARLLNQLGVMYRRQADYISAVRCFAEALDIFTNHKERDGQGQTLRLLGDVHRFRNQLTEAATVYSEALQIITELGHEIERAYILFGLAETYLLRHDHGKATKLYSECLEIYTKTGAKRDRATALLGLGKVHRAQGQYSEAISLYSEASQIYEEVGDRRERALALCSLANVHRFREENSGAISLYSEALQIFTDVGDHKERGNALWGLAEVHRTQQRYEAATKFYSEVMQISTVISDVQGRGAAIWGLAESHRLQHNYGEAIKLYSDAMQIFKDIGDKYFRAETLMSLAVTNETRGHSDEAIALYTEASEVLEEMGNSGRASSALQRAADIRKTLQGASTGSVETVKVGEDPLSTSE